MDDRGLRARRTDSKRSVVSQSSRSSLSMQHPLLGDPHAVELLGSHDFAGAPTGKTTAEAMAYLTAIIDEVESTDSFSLVRGLYCPSAIAAIVSGLALMLVYLMSSPLENSLLSSFLLFASASVTFAVSFFDMHLNSTECKRRLQPARRYLETIKDESMEEIVHDLGSKAMSPNFQSVLRDSKWVSLPNVALVPGDLVQLRDGMQAPCSMEAISSGKSKKVKRLFKGDTLRLAPAAPSHTLAPKLPMSAVSRAASHPSAQPNTQQLPSSASSAHASSPLTKPSGYQQKVVFRVLECPFQIYIDALVDAGSSTRPANTLSNQKRAFRRRSNHIAAFLITVGILHNTIMLISKWNETTLPTRTQLLIMLAQQPLVCALPSLGLSDRFFNILIDAFGNGVLIQTDIDLRQARPQDSSIGLGPNKLQNLRVLWNQRRATFYHILSEVFGLGTALTRTVNPFETLGQITAVCVLDKDGIISEEYSAPEHVLVWDHATPVVLDLIADHESANRVTFEHNWEQHFDSVKPLGMSCLLTATCAEASELALTSPKFQSPSASGDLHGAPTEYDAILRSQDLRSECLCHIGREVGFTPDFAIKTFQKLQSIHLIEIPTVIAPNVSGQAEPIRGLARPLTHMSSLIVRSINSNLLQLFTRGDPSLVMSHCDYVWNRTQPLALSGVLRKKTFDIVHHWAHVDFKCVAFAYSPVPPRLIPDLENLATSAVILTRNASDAADALQEKDSVAMEFLDEHWDDAPKPDSTDMYSSLLNGQILLGITAMRPPPKPEMPYVIEDLTKAGIRFVFFSKLGRRKSIAFTSKLGLESDWNFFISLKDRNDAAAPVAPSEAGLNISKLPEGISKIRDHIELVDNVPLLVSLFTDSTPETAREMIAILQENGESVLCIGSSLNDFNFTTFLQSDVAIGLEPRHEDDHSVRGLLSRHEDPYISFAKHVNSLPCAFALTSSINLRTYLGGMISQSRNLLIHANQTYLFSLACSFSTLLICILSILVGLPCIFRAYHILFLTWVIIPIISCSLLMSHPNRQMMQIIMEKNIAHLSSINRFTWYFLARFLPSVMFSLGIYWWLLAQLIPETASLFFIWEPQSYKLLLEQRSLDAILVAQNYALLAFVYCLAWLSMGFVYRNDSIRQRNPFVNWIWLCSTLVALGVQVLFTALSTTIQPGLSLYKPVLALLAWPIVIIIIDELVKRHDRTSYRRHQQRLRIVFDTKLGMHSPK